MEAAERVIDRLDQIERLKRVGAAPSQLLAEIRELLAEGEAWVRAEGAGTESAAAALDRCRESLDRARAPTNV